MKTLPIVIALLGLVGLLAYTNPSMNNYEAFYKQKFQQEASKGSDPLIGALGSLLSGIASSVMTSQTARRDFVIFSTYDTTMLDKHIKAIGVLNNFIVTQQPDLPSEG